MNKIGFLQNLVLDFFAFFGKWIYLIYWKTLTIEEINPEFAPKNISSENNAIGKAIVNPVFKINFNILKFIPLFHIKTAFYLNLISFCNIIILV